jgi:hypothetical protein
MATLRKFTYDIRDRVFCHGENTVVIDIESAVILGEYNTWMIWDNQIRGYVETKALMVQYEGFEYGSTTSTGEELKCNPCSDPQNPFQIFEPQFEKQFE